MYLLLLYSTRYGTESRSYDNVIQGCGLAWNSSLSLLTTPTNREGIREPFFNILNNVMKLIGRRTEVIMIVTIANNNDVMF